MEEKTREQASSRLWFRMRTGRITASKFKNACHTDSARPSHSLIMSICHPEIARFNTEATKWGCHHEKTARDANCRYQKEKHVNFTVSDSGLFLSTEHPFLGASPDGLVTCECCGAGGCETKVLMRGNTVYVYFLYLLEIIVMTSKKIINTKTSFEQLQLLLTH